MRVQSRRLTRQESRLMTRELLVNAAEEVFLRAGFEHSSVEEIAQQAGFSRGAFYSNFADKDDLALAVIDKRRRDAADALKGLQRISDPVRQRTAIREWFSKQCLERGWIALRIEFGRRALRNPAFQGRLAELCRQEIRTCSTPVAQSFPSTRTPPEVTALALLAACHGLGCMGFHAAPDLEQLSEAAARLVFDCLTGTQT